MAKSTAKSTAERVAAYHRRQQAKGLKRLWVWAYPEDAKKIRMIANELKLQREEAK